MNRSTWLIISIITILLVALSCSKPNEPDLNIPHSPIPKNNAIDQQKQLTLSCICNNANYFYLYLGKDTLNLTRIASIISEDSAVFVITIPNFDFETTFYWCVDVRTNEGDQMYVFRQFRKNVMTV